MHNQLDISSVKLSQDLLYAVKTGSDTAEIVKNISSINGPDLLAELGTNEQKLAFWLNIYNSFTQIQLKEAPERYTNRKTFFTRKSIEIANEPLSLDNIEHGILRNARWKWSLGYLPTLFISPFIRKHKVERVNWRIHFALNCGAKSCPPIAFYEAEQIYEQLEMAAASYLEQEVKYNTNTKTAQVPALMNWFRADFGGIKGIKKILTTFGLVPKNTPLSLSYNSYSWELELDNYKK